ncbi:maleylacetoacetate isomerase [Caenispirillum salinarum]|uniref:maleylacetoacetate isomerase n=1 Tax=Caenispirillum salinarum TaxID=859058 RepID=UPI00384C5962
MRLYTYWRSSTSYRVRIALNLKGLSAEQVPVHLVRDGGEHKQPAYTALNPQAGVPTLVEDDGRALTQSLAICEYLDEVHPHPPLLPTDAAGRARVRAFALAISCEIHPLTNLRVLKHLTGHLGLSEDTKLEWYRHWTVQGLTALEAMVAGHPDTGDCVHGFTPTLADLCLVPQMYNARRFNVGLELFPTLVRIDAHCRDLEAFKAAAPEAQPDADT